MRFGTCLHGYSLTAPQMYRNSLFDVTKRSHRLPCPRKWPNEEKVILLTSLPLAECFVHLIGYRFDKI